MSDTLRTNDRGNRVHHLPATLSGWWGRHSEDVLVGLVVGCATLATLGFAVTLVLLVATS